MSDVEFSQRVQRADQWSWVVSTLVTIVFFTVSIWLTLNVQFSAVVSAGTGIGVQFLLPYYASISVPVDQRQSLEDHPTADDFHHGAAGGSLIIGSVIAFIAMYVTAESTGSLLIGGLWFVVSFVLLKRRLPRRWS